MVTLATDLRQLLAKEETHVQGLFSLDWWNAIQSLVARTIVLKGSYLLTTHRASQHPWSVTLTMKFCLSYLIADLCVWCTEPQAEYQFSTTTADRQTGKTVVLFIYYVCLAFSISQCKIVGSFNHNIYIKRIIINLHKHHVRYSSSFCHCFRFPRTRHTHKRWWTSP